jgi:hypothetical protein
MGPRRSATLELSSWRGYKRQAVPWRPHSSSWHCACRQVLREGVAAGAERLDRWTAVSDRGRKRGQPHMDGAPAQLRRRMLATGRAALAPLGEGTPDGPHEGRPGLRESPFPMSRRGPSRERPCGYRPAWLMVTAKGIGTFTPGQRTPRRSPPGHPPHGIQLHGRPHSIVRHLETQAAGLRAQHCRGRQLQRNPYALGRVAGERRHTAVPGSRQPLLTGTGHIHVVLPTGE